MAEKGGPKKTAPKGLFKLYDVKGPEFKRLRKSCPKCGPGMVLADHKNRVSCGKCHYTEFKKSEK